MEAHMIMRRTKGRFDLPSLLSLSLSLIIIPHGRDTHGVREREGEEMEERQRVRKEERREIKKK